MGAILPVAAGAMDRVVHRRRTKRHRGANHWTISVRALVVLFCLDSLWVKSQNYSDRDAIPERSVLHASRCPGPLRASRGATPTHVGRKECLQCVTTV